MERIFLLELTGWNPLKSGGAGIETLYYSTHEYISGPLDTPPNQYYEPRISDPGVFSQSIYSIGTTGGSSSGGFGAITLVNVDSALDPLIDWGFDGRACVTYMGPKGYPKTAFSIVTSGTIEQPVHNWNNITLRYKDGSLELDKPIALSYYGGTNVLPAGVDGTIDLKGKEKPRLFGCKYNFEPVCVNTSKLIYQISDTTDLNLANILAVRDLGVPLTPGIARTITELQDASNTLSFTCVAASANMTVTAHPYATGDKVTLYSTGTLPAPAQPRTVYYLRSVDANTVTLHHTYSDATDNKLAVTFTSVGIGVHKILKNSAPLGGYDWCFDATGIYFKLGSAPSGQITVDATVVPETLASCIKRIVVEKIGTTRIVNQSITDLASSVPSTLWGFYTGQKGLTTKTVLDDLCKAGIWWGFDNESRFWAKQFSAPTTNKSIAEITEKEALTVERSATDDSGRGVPIWKVICRYQQKGVVQTSVAGQIDVNLYNKEWLEAVYSNASVLTKNPLAQVLTIDTPYNDYTVALAEATRQYNMRSVRRDRMRISLVLPPEGPLSYPEEGYMDDDAVTDILSYAPMAGQLRYVLWGSKLVSFGGYKNYFDITGINSDMSIVTTVARREKGDIAFLDLANPKGTWQPLSASVSPTFTSGGGSFYNHQLVGSVLYISGGRILTGASLTTQNINGDIYKMDLNSPTSTFTLVTSIPSTGYFQMLVYNNKLFLLSRMSIISEVSTYQSNQMIDLGNIAGGWVDIGNSGVDTDVAKGAVLWGNKAILSYEPGFKILNLDSPSSAYDLSLPPLPNLNLTFFGMFIQGNFLIVINGYDELVTSQVYAEYSIDLTNISEGWITGRFPVPPYLSNSLFGGTYNSKLVYGYTKFAMQRVNSDPADTSELTSIGRQLSTKFDRYGYEAGRPMRLIGTEKNFKDRKITLDLWG